MKQKPDNAKYILQNQLRTWSDLKRRAAMASDSKPTTSHGNNSHYGIPSHRWGGCAEGCDHGKFNLHRKPRRQNTQDFIQQPPIASQTPSEKEDHPFAPQEEERTAGMAVGAKYMKRTLTSSKSAPEGKATTTNNDGGSRTESPASKSEPTGDVLGTTQVTVEVLEDGAKGTQSEAMPPNESSDEVEGLEGCVSIPSDHLHSQSRIPRPDPLFLALGRDAGGSRSGVGSPNDGSDDSDYFDTTVHQLTKRLSLSRSSKISRHESPRSILSQVEDVDNSLPLLDANNSTEILERRSSLKNRTWTPSNEHKIGRKERSASIKTEKEWVEESGMTGQNKADALGDMHEEPDDLDQLTEEDIDKLKDNDRKGFSEVY